MDCVYHMLLFWCYDENNVVMSSTLILVWGFACLWDR